VSWINDNKGKGMWKSGAQGAKTEYNEGDRISKLKDPVWQAKTYTGVKSIPITDTHMPCGYWDKWLDPNSSDSGYHPAGSIPDLCICDAITISPTSAVIIRNSSQELSVVNAVEGCSYTWGILSGGGTLSTTVGTSTVYNAPSIATVATIYISVQGMICAYATITVELGCESASIGYTGDTISCGNTKILAVLNGDPAITYTWGIISGGGSIEKIDATYAIYTAPADNPNCDLNPIIALLAGSFTCDLLSLAVNGASGVAGYYVNKIKCYSGYYCYEFYQALYCNGSVEVAIRSRSCGGTWISCWDQDEEGHAFYNDAICIGCTELGYHDLRSEAQLSAGCCPAQLL